MTITSFRIFVVFPNEEFYSRELREVNLIRGGGNNTVVVGSSCVG